MATHGSVLSVNVGRSAPLAGSEQKGLSGIDKQPTGTVSVRDPGDRSSGGASGVVGDVIVDQRHHGGERQAVYAVAREELDYWQTRLERPLACGVFGENLTTSGLAVDELLIGSRVSVGEVELEVCGPRIPCATFAAHMGERGWVKAFTARGRPGAYFAVRAEGRITSGDTVAVVSQPEHDITVSVVFAALSGDLDAASTVLQAGVLPPEEHTALAARVARRTKG